MTRATTQQNETVARTIMPNKIDDLRCHPKQRGGSRYPPSKEVIWAGRTSHPFVKERSKESPSLLGGVAPPFFFCIYIISS